MKLDDSPYKDFDYNERRSVSSGTASAGAITDPTPRPYTLRLALDHLDGTKASFSASAVTLTVGRDVWQQLGRPGLIDVEVRTKRA